MTDPDGLAVTEIVAMMLWANTLYGRNFVPDAMLSTQSIVDEWMVIFR